jgi:hypothetical protein
VTWAPPAWWWLVQALMTDLGLRDALRSDRHELHSERRHNGLEPYWPAGMRVQAHSHAPRSSTPATLPSMGFSSRLHVADGICKSLMEGELGSIGQRACRVHRRAFRPGPTQ